MAAPSAATPTAPWYRWDGNDLILRLQVQTRASRDELGGQHGERLKVRLKAVPVDGKANARLCAFLAQLFAVPKTAVVLEAGAGSREKRIRIHQPRRLPEEIPPA